MLRKILCLSVLLVGTAAAFGQALPAAIRNANLEAGGQFAAVRPDYGSHDIFGFGGVVDANARKWYGLELEANYSFINGPASTKESTYLFGPRIIYVHDRWIPYGKAMIGIGKISLPTGVTQMGHTVSTSDTAYVFGGGVDWRWKRNLTVRIADIEYQTWPGFGSPNPIYRPGSLTPLQLTVGMKFRFFQ